VNPLPRWRAVAGCVVLAALVLFAVLFTPVYIRNLKLQNYVDDITRAVENQRQPDAVLRGWVIEKARSLHLPVTENNVHIIHGPEGLGIEVAYSVKVDMPMYQVNLHFYPGAGSR